MKRQTISGFLLASLWMVGGCRGCLGLEEPTLLVTGAGGSGGEGGGGSGGATTSSTTSSETCTLPEVACYSGPAGTQDIGNCKGGTQTCEPDADSYGPCLGEITPAQEDCDEPGDEDCDSFACSETIWVQHLPNVKVATLATDRASGDIYVAGAFSGTVTLGSDVLESAGGDDVFMAKLDHEGKIGWTLRLGGTKSEGPVGIAYHDQTVTVLIKTAGSLDIGGTTVPAGVVAVRLDAGGALIWAGFCSGDVSGRLTVDPVTGDALIAGRFSQLNCGSQDYFSGGDYDLFVSRLGAADGSEVKTNVWQSGAEQVATAVAADQEGNVLFAGESAQAFNLGPTGIAAGMYAAKIAPNGAYLWANSFGTGNVPGIATDASGNLLLASNCQGDPNDFGGGPLPLVGSGSDVCLAKLSGGDNSEIWARRFGIPGSQSSVGPISPVSIDSSGNFALAGSTNGALAIDGKVVSTSGFLVGFNGTDAKRRWLRPLDINAANLAYSKQDTLAVAGTFGPGTADLGKGPITTAPMQIDSFVMLIAP